MYIDKNSKCPLFTKYQRPTNPLLFFYFFNFITYWTLGCIVHNITLKQDCHQNKLIKNTGIVANYSVSIYIRLCLCHCIL